MTDTGNASEIKKCEACGEDFGCGAATGECWCFSVDMDREALATIAAKFDQCLCSKCLLAYAADVEKG